MSTMSAFTLRSLKKNRVRSAVAMMGIALSCALLTAVFVSVASIQHGLLERTLATEGAWQAFSPDVSDELLEALNSSENIVDLVVSKELGSAQLTHEESRTLGEFVALRTLPFTQKGSFEPGGTPIALLPELLEGRMPQADNEIILPDYAKSETLGQGATDPGALSDGPLEVGSTLTLTTGMRTVTQNNEEHLLNSKQHRAITAETSNGKENEALAETTTRSYKVVGIYRHQPSDWTMGANFTSSLSSMVALVGGEEPELQEGITSAHITLQGFTRTQDIHSFLASQSTNNASNFTLHSSLIRYQGISDGRALGDTLWVVAAVLSLVILIASVSLIYNAFAISVAERTRQFGLLSSIGASKRQLRSSVLFEALILGAISIPAGILIGLGGVGVVFALTQEAFAALLGTENGLVIQAHPALLALTVLLSVLVLVISAWIPAYRAGKVCAVDAIRQTQEIRLTKRAARKTKQRERKSTQNPSSAATIKSTLMGRLFGVPGFLATRNLSRAAARGRTVVASLSVSVLLIVIAGSISIYLSPIADRASSKDGAGSQADVVVSGNVFNMSDKNTLEQTFASFIEDARQIEGVSFLSSYYQGQTQAVIDTSLLSNSGIDVIVDQEKNKSSWLPSALAEEGTYCGNVAVFYLDDTSYNALAQTLGVETTATTPAEPTNPRAIALNKFQGILPNGTYADLAPFASTGTFSTYSFPTTFTKDEKHYTSLGVQKSGNGETVIAFVEQTEGEDKSVTSVPWEEIGTEIPLKVVALAPEQPAAINSGSATFQIPVVLLPQSIISAAQATNQEEETRAEAAGAEGLYTYYWVTLSFTASDHTSAASELKELVETYDLVDYKVFDIAEASRQNRLIMQAIELFIFCFSAITILIAVANVFNTLSNSIILRTREFAVLKSIGMDNKTFARMLMCECATYALRGLAFGLAGGIAGTFALYCAILLSFTGVTFSLPWLHIGAAIGVVLVVLAASVAFALRKSHAANVVQALRSDY